MDDTSIAESLGEVPAGDNMAAARAALAAKRAAASEKVGVLSPEQLLSNQIKRSQGQQVSTQRTIAEVLGSEPAAVQRHNDSNNAGRAMSNVDFKTTPRIKMYKKDAQGIYRPTLVVAGSVPDCVEAGYLLLCPDCGTDECTEDPNSCTGRAAVPFRRCPIRRCNDGNRKVFHDIPVLELDESELEEGEIANDYIKTLTTPAERTKYMQEQHMLAFHHDEALAMGIQPVQDRPSPQRPRALTGDLVSV